MWTYNGIPFDETMVGDNVGFVYMIHNTKNGRKYIGKKLFKFTRTKKRKGKRNVKVKKASDWELYYGSNEELNLDVEVMGKEYFLREILVLCPSKGKCNYWEAKLQFQNKVLESDDWYNSWISCKIHKTHIKGKVTA